MRLICAKMLIAFAISILLVHDVIPHYHEALTEMHLNLNHDIEHHKHNLLSILVLDDDFLISKSNYNFNSFIGSPVFLFPDQYIFSEFFTVVSKSNLPVIEEFPPPDWFCNSPVLRGPPSV